jgi:hypothetical protein
LPLRRYAAHHLVTHARNDSIDFFTPPPPLAWAQTKLETFLERNKTVDNIVHYNYTNNMAIRE